MTIRQLLDWWRQKRGGCSPRDGGMETFFDEPTSTPHGSLVRLVMPELEYSDMRLRQHERADYQTVDYRLLTFTGVLIRTMMRQGIPMYCHTAFRDALEQARLKAKGRSRALFPHAPHCQGFAVDIVHSSFHWNMTEQEWAMIGKIGKDTADRLGIPIVWGGDWGFYDPAHWEIADWRDHVKPTVVETTPVRYTPQKLYKEFPSKQLARS